MANNVNLFDPLGIANAARNQVNKMATAANLPGLPQVPHSQRMPTPQTIIKTPTKVVQLAGYARDRYS